MTKKAMFDYFVQRLATAKDETVYEEGRTYACAVLGQKLSRNTRGAFRWIVFDIKTKADDKLSQPIDDNLRQFVQGISDVCKEVIRRTRTWGGIE